MPQYLTFSLLVGAGGFVGSIARYMMTLLSQKLPVTWPFGTFSTNVLGCLIIGGIMALSDRGEVVSPEMRLALATGFCGGFTTMSSMIYETAGMFRDGEYVSAVAYSFGTLIVCLAAFIVGSLTVRLFFKSGGGVWN